MTNKVCDAVAEFYGKKYAAGSVRPIATPSRENGRGLWSLTIGRMKTRPAERGASAPALHPQANEC